VSRLGHAARFFHQGHGKEGHGTMSSRNGNGLDLSGDGGAYLRVSGDRQELQRQLDSIGAFERRHGVKIPQANRYEDDMPRDLSDKRPDFQRMLKDAQSGKLKWIVVDMIDRFGFADEWELVMRIGQLREAGCKLYDTDDDEWTGQGLMSFFKAGLAGHSSHDEQVKKSHRCLGGMVVKARAGEWQGAPPKLGFDVGCFDRATGAELWRVVWEGRDVVGKTKRRGKVRPVYHIRRRKVYPDGRTERLDGNVVFRTNKDTQVMRIVPTCDPAKLDAAKGVFRRYATEAVSFFDLAKWLNRLGIRNSMGNTFQSNDVRKMLWDEAYLGYPTFSKRRSGRFHRHDAEGGITELEPELRGKDTTSDPADVIRSSVRLFDPIVDRKTWDAVQRKLRGRPKTSHAPKNPGLYLAGIVTCAGCGAPMVARTDRMEYYCATWDKHRVRGALDECPCERNGVRQAVLEGYIGRFLEETGKRLDLLTEGSDGNPLVDRLEDQEEWAWREFALGMDRLMAYLSKHCPEDYAAIVRDSSQEDSTHFEFVQACLDCYRARFDPSASTAEIERLEAEHTELMGQWADLPTPRAKEKARARFTELEARIEELKRQQEDAAEVVEQHYQQMNDLQQAIEDAQAAMRSEADAQSLRRRAEALRGLLCRIECEFVLTGKTGTCTVDGTTRNVGGAGNSRSMLSGVSFVPISGDGLRIPVNERDGTCGNDPTVSRGNDTTRLLLRLLTVRYIVG
jgi:DNA invertase Pin-like site-specific DNA recombinase